MDAAMNPRPAEDPLPEDASSETGPLRRCLATGEHLPKERLVRFVLSPEGEAVPDIAGKLPGRGFWLKGERAMLADAAGLGRLFARAARQPVRVAPDLADRVERQLARRCLDRIGLARRAGQAMAGADKVAEALGRGLGRGGVLIEAADRGAAAGDKMERLADGATVVALFGAEDIGAVFGRERTVHALIAAGGHADAFRADAARLQYFRLPPAQAA